MTTTHDIDLPEPSSSLRRARASTTSPAGEVTLVVYGWHNVQPGTLAWVFPSLRAALGAARAMRNAVRWAVVQGRELVELDIARARGLLLAEQPG